MLAVRLAFEMKMPLFVCVMMGVITGIFGGVLRDAVVMRSRWYSVGTALCYLRVLGCWVYLGFGLAAGCRAARCYRVSL